MSATVRPETAGSPPMAVRDDPRQRIVHVVEYSHYPRRSAGEARRIAYTQDRSAMGLGLDLPESVAPGELLQVTLRDIDGATAVDGLARVVWCRETANGRARAGLEMLREKGERPMLRVRQRESLDRNHTFSSGSQ